MESSIGGRVEGIEDGEQSCRENQYCGVEEKNSLLLGNGRR